MKTYLKSSLAIVGAFACLTTATTARAQLHNPMGGSPLSAPFTKPKPLGLKGVMSTPPSKYNRAATAKALATHKKRTGPGSSNVLVLYDSAGAYGWLGDLYSQQMQNLLTHFGANITRLPVEKYTAGLMNSMSATFYMGVLYDNPLPASFTSDALSTTKPLCWMGYNLWKIAWNADYSWNNKFINRFGFTFYYMDSLGYPTVQYKGQTLSKAQWEPVQGRVEITNSALATRVATSSRTDGLAIGYITRGANLTYVADNPFSYVSYLDQNDRILAFEDTIHDVLNSGALENHRSVLRIEDVSPIVPAATLMAIADTCSSENIPFIVCVIPRFADPLGVVSGRPRYRDMTNHPLFINALKYMESKGGKVVMHGYTHQYSNVKNPEDGESADDFEFFRVAYDSNGNQAYQGPVSEDSSSWVLNRITTGQSLLFDSGFTNVTGFVTPHYMASPVDYVELQKKFQYMACRGLTFSQGSDGVLRYIQQHCPWVYTDTFGIKRIPETIGYVDMNSYPTLQARTPATLISYAKANLCVRDGFAGMYFHWFYDPALLKQLIQGVKGLGYQFVMPDASLN